MLTTIQDLGRLGYQRFGVSISGAMDRWALIVGNRLLGNPDQAAGLEVTVQGPDLLFEQSTTLTITGADLSASSDGCPLPMWTVIVMRKGTRLQFGVRLQGTRAYIAIAGGLDGPLILGSRSTHLHSRVGSLGGRALVKGDRLGTGAALPAHASQYVGRALPLPHRPHYSNSPTVRIVPGPQADRFSPQALHVLTEKPYQLTSKCDRMGYCLLGTALTHQTPADIVSHAVTCGTIQVPAAGQPILLMADSQTTGGYPVLATMIAADRSPAAQLCPGDHLSFTRTTQSEALAFLAAQQAELNRILPPLPESGFTTRP